MIEKNWEDIGRPAMTPSLRGIGLFKGNMITLCYSCRKSGHLAKEFPGGRPSCLCCKALDHEVLDSPRMIAKLEGMNLNQEANPEIKEPQKN